MLSLKQKLKIKKDFNSIFEELKYDKFSGMHWIKLTFSCSLCNLYFLILDFFIIPRLMVIQSESKTADFNLNFCWMRMHCGKAQDELYDQELWAAYDSIIEFCIVAYLRLRTSFLMIIFIKFVMQHVYENVSQKVNQIFF